MIKTGIKCEIRYTNKKISGGLVFRFSGRKLRTWWAPGQRFYENWILTGTSKCDKILNYTYNIQKLYLTRFDRFLYFFHFCLVFGSWLDFNAPGARYGVSKTFLAKK